MSTISSGGDTISKEYNIPSVVVEKKSNQEIEAFAVIQDFLRKTSHLFLDGQKMAFKVGVTLLVIGGVMFGSVLFLKEFTMILLLIPLALVFIGMYGIIRFFVKKPSYIKTIQKVHWPFAVTRVHSTKERYAAFDMTCKKNFNKLKHTHIHQKKIGSSLKTLPKDNKTYEKEMKIRNILTRTENFTDLREIGLPVVDSPYFKDILQYSYEGISKGNHLPRISFEKISKDSKRLSLEIELAKENISYAKEKRRELNDYVDKYIGNIDDILDEEREFSLTSIGNYMEQVNDPSKFFDPIVDRLYDDIRNELNIIETIGEREMSRIEDRIKSDKRNISMIYSQMIKQLEGEMRGFEVELKKNESQMRAYQNAKKSLQEARDAALESLDDAGKEIENARQEMDNTEDAGKKAKERAENAKNKTEETVHRSEARQMEEHSQRQATVKAQGAKNSEQMAKMEARRYNTEIDRVNEQVKAAKEHTRALQSTMGEVTQQIEETLDDMQKKVSAVIEEGEEKLKEVNEIVRNKRELIQRHPDHVEALQEDCSEILTNARELMTKEMQRHLGPLENRKELIDSERNRINDKFQQNIDFCMGFLSRTNHLSFKYPWIADPSGIYYLPYWIIKYEDNGRMKTELYSLSFLNQDNRLTSLESNLQVNGDWFLDKFRGDIPTGVDKRLFSEVERSGELFQDIKDIGTLDYLGSMKGVINLVK